MENQVQARGQDTQPNTGPAGQRTGQTVKGSAAQVGEPKFNSQAEKDAYEQAKKDSGVSSTRFHPIAGTVRSMPGSPLAPVENVLPANTVATTGDSSAPTGVEGVPPVK